MPRLLFLLLLLVLAGCSLAPGDEYLPDSFTEAREKWERLSLQDYQMTLERSCFCGEEQLGPFEIRVAGGRVVSATRAGESVGITEVLSIDDLFDLLDTAYSEAAHSVHVSYHPASGYPLSLSIDRSRDISDEEVGYTVSRLSTD